MPTYYQLTRRVRKNRYKRWKRKELNACPQRQGKCLRVYKLTPKKPCSARRTIARVWLTSKKIIFCHFPGVNPTNIRIHTGVLVRGGRPVDLPAVRYRAIAGAGWKKRRWGFEPIFGRVSSRSVFGIPNIRRTKMVRFEIKRLITDQRAGGVITQREIELFLNKFNILNSYIFWEQEEEE